MPLPKIATPSYELELPSTGKTIQYRPFLVKEEKLLVIALESEDTKQITNAIKAVIRACILTKGVKVESLPTFDIEFLFLNIRGKSVGEDLEVNIVCPDDGKTSVPVTINLDVKSSVGKAPARNAGFDGTGKPLLNSGPLLPDLDPKAFKNLGITPLGLSSIKYLE